MATVAGSLRNKVLVLDDVTTGDLTVTGSVTISGTATTLNSTNTSINDSLIELNAGLTGSNPNDLGLILERGSTGNNVFIGWDESADKVIVATTTADGTATGNLSLTEANFQAAGGTFTGNVGMATGASSGKFAVMSSAVHGSYDFYNNGTSYFNGTTEVNAEFKISSSASYITHFNYLDGGNNIISQANGGSTTIRNNNGNLLSLGSTGNLAITGSITSGGNTVWHAGNDGSGSGLDADLLDGQHGTYYRNASNLNTGTIPTARLPNPISISGGNAIIKLQETDVTNSPTWWTVADGGNYSIRLNNTGTYPLHIQTNSNNNAVSEIRLGYATTIQGNTAWHAGNDGSGSGLDADTLDGINSGSFLRSDANDSYSGVLSLTGELTLATGATRIDGSDGHPLVQVNSSRAYFGSTNRSVSTIATNSTTGLKANVSGTDYTVWHAGNDGSGSGLDADTLDGQHGSYYAPASTVPTVNNGTLTITTSGSVSGGGSFTANNAGNVTLNLTGSGIMQGTNAVGNGSFSNTIGAGFRFQRVTGGSNRFTTSHHNVLQIPNTSGDQYLAQIAFGTGTTRLGWRSKDTSFGSWYEIWHAGNDGSGTGLDADTVDGIQASSFLRSNATDTASGNLTLSGSNIYSGNNEFTDEIRVVTGSVAASNTTKGLMFDGNYETGQYRHRWRKLDNGGGVPLYLDYSEGTANSYTTIARFGPYTNNTQQFEVYGNAKVDKLEISKGSGTSDLVLGTYSNTDQGILYLTGSTANKQSVIKTTNGNLHIDSNSGNNTYINFYSGAGTYFGTGAGGVAAVMGADGDLWKGSADNTGSKYWHAGNDGGGSGLDADLLDGQHGSYYAQYNHFRSLGAPAFTGGSNPNITTAQYVSEMESDGAFDSYTSAFKTSWSYAGNYNLSDAGSFGPTETAGMAHLTWTDNADDTTRGNITVLAIAPNTGGSAGGVYVYNDQGSSYAPGWREIWTSSTDGAGSGLDADTLDGIQGASLLRSDTADTGSGKITLTATEGLEVGGIRGRAIGDQTGDFIQMYERVHIGYPSGWGATAAAAPAYGLSTWGGAEFNKGNVSGAPLTFNSNAIWHAGNDGSGSGLDADTVDGIQGASLLRSDAADTASGALTFTGNINQTSGTFISHGSQVSSLTTAWQAAGTSKSRGLLPFRFQNGATGQPESGDNAHWGLNIYAHSGSSGNYPYGTQLSAGSTQNLWHRWWANGTAQAWRKIWDTANDGSGSGLDADLLDGQQGSYYLPSNTTRAAITNSTWAGTSGYPGYTFSGGNSRFGFSSTAGVVDVYADGNYYATDSSHLVWHAGNDGSGSGLDADLLDGQQGSYYLNYNNFTNTPSIPSSSSFITTSSTAQTKSGILTLSGGLIVDGSIDSGGTDMGFYQSAGTNIVLKGDSNGRSGIFFQSEKNGTNINHPSDYGFIQFHPYGYGNTSGEVINMVIGTANDSNDQLILQTPYTTGLKFGYKNATSGTGLTTGAIWHFANDGAGSGLDADTVDGINSGSFLRSDTADTATGRITLQYGVTSDFNSIGGTQGVTAFYAANVGGVSNRPDTGNYATGLEFVYHDTSARSQLAAGSVGSNNQANFYVRSEAWSSNSWTSWYKLWHTGNDGSGSGLDADTVDGVQASSFLRSDAADTFTGVITGNQLHLGGSQITASSAKLQVNGFQRTGTIYLHEGASAGSTNYALETVGSELRWNASKIWTVANDGSGSGLDADTLDGSHKSSFLVNTGSGDFTYNPGGSSPNILLGHDPTTNVGSALIAVIKQTAQYAPGLIRFYISPTGTTNSTSNTYKKFEFQHDGDLHADGDVIAYSTTTGSDRKLKENIRNLEGSLDKTLKLRGVKFDWKDEKRANDQLGFIAQEVQEVLPEVVKEVETLTKEGETHLTVNYPAVVPLLVEAIKEQQSIINRLEERLSDLESKLK